MALFPRRRHRCENCGNETTVQARTLTYESAPVIEWPEPRCASDACAAHGFPLMALVLDESDA